MAYGEKINLTVMAERAILAKRELEKALGVLKDENVSYPPPDSVSPPQHDSVSRRLLWKG